MTYESKFQQGNNFCTFKRTSKGRAECANFAKLHTQSQFAH
jgi:hypothetical protein